MLITTPGIPTNLDLPGGDTGGHVADGPKILNAWKSRSGSSQLSDGGVVGYVLNPQIKTRRRVNAANCTNSCTASACVVL